MSKHGSTWKNVEVKGMENQSFNHSCGHLRTLVYTYTIHYSRHPIPVQYLDSPAPPATAASCRSEVVTAKTGTHATNATYERADPLSLFHSFVFICFFGSAVVLDLDLPEGEGRKTALGEAPRNRCRPASALCPDMARGENQMSTSTDNNASPL